MNDENEILLRWNKRNFILRIFIIIILIFLGAIILYNHYGTPPNLQDSQLLDSLGNPIIDCREALVYYAEHSLNIINSSQRNELALKYNMTLLQNLIVNNSN